MKQNKTTDLRYPVLNVDQSNRFDVFLQEAFVELCPFVVSENHAVAIQQSHDVTLHLG